MTMYRPGQTGVGCDANCGQMRLMQSLKGTSPKSGGGKTSSSKIPKLTKSSKSGGSGGGSKSKLKGRSFDGYAIHGDEEVYLDVRDKLLSDDEIGSDFRSWIRNVAPYQKYLEDMVYRRELDDQTDDFLDLNFRDLWQDTTWLDHDIRTRNEQIDPETWW